VHEFLEHAVVRNVLPERGTYKIDCLCLPKMNIRAPDVPFTDRVVICGDAGSTRLFKDGMGAAYIMGKAAAKTAVFCGASKEHFRRDYYPVYGVINMSRASKELFTLEDLKLLRSIAIYASIAVENAMNFAKLNHVADEILSHAATLEMWHEDSKIN